MVSVKIGVLKVPIFPVLGGYPGTLALVQKANFSTLADGQKKIVGAVTNVSTCTNLKAHTNHRIHLLFLICHRFI